MSKRKSYMQMIYERHKFLPLCPEYKKIFFDYARLFFKWMDHINRALFDHKELSQSAHTAASIKKCAELEDILKETCWLRDTILVVLSMLMFIGLNTPTKSTLDRLTELHDIIDNNLLSYMVIAQRYRNAIRNHKRLSLKGTTKPLSVEEIRKLDCWPIDSLMDACFYNGSKILNLQSFTPRDVS